MDNEGKDKGVDLLRRARLKRLYAKESKARPKKSENQDTPIFPRGREEASLSALAQEESPDLQTLPESSVPVEKKLDEQQAPISGFQLETLSRQIAGGLSLSAIGDELLGSILVCEDFQDQVQHFLNLYLSYCSKEKRLRLTSFMLFERFDLFNGLHQKVVELLLVELATSTEFSKFVPFFLENIYDFDIAKMTYQPGRRKYSSPVVHWFAIQAFLFKGEYRSASLVLNLFGKDILQSIGKAPFDIDLSEFLLISGRVCILAEEYQTAERYLGKISPRSRQYRVGAQLLDSLSKRKRKPSHSKPQESFTSLPEKLRFIWIEERLAGFPSLKEQEKIEVKRIVLTLDQHFPGTIYWKTKLSNLLISAIHLHQSDFGFLSSWLQARATEQTQASERLAVWSEVKRFGCGMVSSKNLRFLHLTGGSELASPVRSDYRYWVFVSHFQCFLGGGLNGVDDLEAAYFLSQHFTLHNEFKNLSEHGISFLDFFTDMGDNEVAFLRTMIYVLNPSLARHATKPMLEKWLLHAPAKPVTVLKKIQKKYCDWHDVFGQVECIRSTAVIRRLSNAELSALSRLWHKEGSSDSFWILMTIAKHRCAISKAQLDMWEVSGENKSLPGLSTQRMELALKVAGRSEGLPLESVKSLFQLMGPLANGLSHVAGFKKIRNKKLTATMSKGMKEHLDKVFEDLFFDGGLHFVSQVSDHPFNKNRLPIVSSVGRGEWSLFLKALYSLSSGDLLVQEDGFRFVQDFLQSVRKSLGKSEPLNPGFKWYNKLGERHRAQLQKVARYFQENDFETVRFHYTIFITRLAVLLFPKHEDALSFAGAHTENVELLKHIEHFLLSDHYAKYRKLTGMQNRSASFLE